MLESVLPIFSLLSFSFIFARISEIRFTSALPIVTSIVISILYIAGMFGFLYQATYAAYILGTATALYIMLGRRTDLFKAISQYRSEIICFVLIAVFFGLYTNGMFLHAWDDHSFWAVISKELLANHKFEDQSIPTAILEVHAHYPRGPSVYHYFMMLIPGFSEGAALFSHFILHLIFLAPLLANRRWQQSVFLISVVLAVAVLYTAAIRSIYNDSTISVIFASILMIYFHEEHKTKVLYSILPLLFFMPLFREIGLIFALIATFIIMYFNISFHKAKAGAFIYILMIALPFLALNLWFWYFGITHDFFGRTEHSFKNLLDIIGNFDQQKQMVAISIFKHSLLFFAREANFVLYVLILFSWYSVRCHKPNLLGFWYRVFAALFTGFVCFVIWRLYLYYTAFTSHEAIQATSLLRYFGTYCIAFAVLAAYFIKISTFKAESATKLNKAGLVVLGVVALLIVGQKASRIRAKSQVNAVRDAYAQIAKKLILDGREVEIKYDNRNDSFDCLSINYRMSPIFTKNELDSCVKAGNSFVEGRANMKMPGSVQSVKTDGKIIYYPFLNKIE